METNIYVDGKTIPLVKNDPAIFLHKSIILYGSSGSGKTVLIKHILHLLKNDIPQIIVINPTNKLNNSYTNIVPRPLIYDEINEDLFKIIYDKQAMSRQVYDRAQKIEPLYELFKKCASPTEKEHYIKMSNIYRDTRENIENKVKHIIDKKSQQKQLKTAHQDSIRIFLKQTIHKNKRILESSSHRNSITPEELQLIKYLYYNPNLLLLFDDCAASFKNWGRNPSVNELFFNGRHFYVTTLMSFQSDTILPPDLRSNTFISIFTTKQCALSFFENKKNGISKTDIKLFNKYIDTIFNKNEDGNNFQKLCYFKNDSDNMIQYIIADVFDTFRFGSPSLWEYCDQIQKNTIDIDTNNPFYESFNM